MSPIEQFYLVLVLPGLQEAARECGYALALHGSVQRDLDLIAVPWIDHPRSAEELVAHLADKINATHDEVSSKPHGRRAWCLRWADNLYADISVMPRTGDTPCPS